MLRLTVLLCAAMFVALLLAGEDKGQMRPGLADAVARGESIVVLQRQSAAPAPASEQASGQAAEQAAGQAVAEAAQEPVAGAVLETAVYIPEPTPAAEKIAPAPVFTLSALPAVAVDTTTAEAAPDAAQAADAPAAASGEVWYVIANSVNVRQEPSTDASIVDKLGRGEAVTVSFAPGSDWAQVSIEGDGLEGYVALRFLSPEAP